MSSPQLSVVAAPSEGSGLPPQRNPKLLPFYLAIDSVCIRLLGVSIVSWRVMKKNRLNPVAALILYTRGRKSGRVLASPLLTFRVGEDYIVLGSVGGAPKHPSWVFNVDANPDCEIHVDRRRFRVRARIAESEEHARLWAKACDVYPYFKDYQARSAPRLIPIIVLTKELGASRDHRDASASE